MLIRGDELTTRQRSLVLTAFSHRWTFENRAYGEHCPACVQQQECGGEMVVDGVPWHEYHKPLVTDEQWLREHAFNFVKDGSRLNGRYRHCEPVY